MDIKLTKVEIRQHLAELLEELTALCDMYDNGQEIVHRSIAMKLRVLFHHTPHSNSLIQQLGISDKLMISTCGKKIPGNLFKHYHGLASILADGEGKSLFVPGKLSSPRREVFIKYWWEEEVILSDDSGHDFFRKNIVLAIANKDGGGHVDPSLPLQYHDLKSGKTSGVIFNRDGVTYTSNPIIASIRQVAQEVIVSFE
ncbi:hypothetical protein ACFSQ3_09610 [Sphingobacterium corticis]|uniref:Uncharacterized protein n=1 Tax=Sphingobacterium corticis TaxID=1812823 RepID=A0ABW5NKP8_9SPHI